MHLPAHAGGKRGAAAGGGLFPPTRWTLVAAAGAGSGAAEEALAELCRIYWRPVFAFIRARGHAPPDAEDLTQGFFAELLARGSLASASAAKGRLRTFLLTAVERHLINQQRREGRQKRGGAFLHVSWERVRWEPSDGTTPEQAYDRQWAETLLAQVMDSLRTEYETGGRAALFEALRPAISLAEGGVSHAAVAERLGTTAGAVKVAVHRLRQRYRQLLRQHIAETVSTPAEVDDEIRHLFSAFSH